MAESKKDGEKSKPIADVEQPGKSKPADTSKPVLVSNRPILKDPMVVDEEGEATKVTVKTGGSKTIKPLEDSPKADLAKEDTEKELKSDNKRTVAEIAAEADAKEPAAEAVAEEPKAEPEADQPEEPAESAETEEPKPETDKKQVDPAKEAEAKAAGEAKHEAEVQELVDSKKYYLPINTVEKRRSKRVVLLGIVLSVILALAWVDVALDAGLIDIGGVKPVTHFFSN